MHITTIIGARPQFIKAAVVSRAFREHRPDVRETIVHTGQHYDANMSDVFFEELDIPQPNHHLGIGGGSHGQNTGRMIEAIETVLVKDKPNWVLVYGDTDSTLAGALAAAKLHVPVAHVEAGLRSFNRRMPEEINRVLTDHLSSVLFTPTTTATENLAREGVIGEVWQVGDVMLDAVGFYKHKARKPAICLPDGDFVLATVHRAENTDFPERLAGIMDALDLMAARVPVLLPLHPRTRALMKELTISPSRVTILDPVGYLEMVWLLSNCQLVLTDSGGLQKEAFFFGKPCITAREETEWVELVQSGWNFVVGARTDDLIRTFETIRASWTPPEQREHYGKGEAGKKLVGYLND